VQKVLWIYVDPSAARLGGSVTQADWLGPKVGDHPTLLLHSSNEPGELSQRQWHDNSTVNIVMTIAVTTPWSIKRCHFVLDFNSHAFRCSFYARQQELL